ncbi:hypothetical protein ACPCG0_09345 [Propionibacteriaceae bacterium Y1923]
MLIAMLRRWDELTGDPLAYARRSITNAVIDQWRRHGRHRSSTPVGDQRPTDATPDDATRGTDAALAWQLCRELPPQQRAVVVLRYWADLPHRDIGSPELPDWHQTRQLGSLVVSVAVPSGSADDDALAQQILASATTFTIDQAGCAPNSPIEKWDWVSPTDSFDLAAIDQVSAISLCQYEKSQVPEAEAVPGPRPVASRQLVDQDAQQLLLALKQAPVGGGPDDPETCAEDYHDAQAIVVRLWTQQGVRDAFAHVGNCRHNGIDDGTNVRTVTREWCLPLFTRPVQWTSMSGSVAGLCSPADQVPSPTTTK